MKPKYYISKEPLIDQVVKIPDDWWFPLVSKSITLILDIYSAIHNRSKKFHLEAMVIVAVPVPSMKARSKEEPNAIPNS